MEKEGNKKNFFTTSSYPFACAKDFMIFTFGPYYFSARKNLYNRTFDFLLYANHRNKPIDMDLVERVRKEKKTWRIIFVDEKAVELMNN